MFRSLAFYNFRIWFVGSLVSNLGGWMQTTAQAWVVLTVLTDGDARVMGVALALQFIPNVVLVPVTGWVADRFDRRRIFQLTETVLALVSVGIGVLLLTHAMTLPLMFAFILAAGVVQAFETPVRQVMVTDLVPLGHASNAVALNSASINGARLIGPAVAGLLLAVTEPGWVFLINAVSFGVMIAALAMIRATDLNAREAHSASAMGIMDGFRYVRRRPDLLVMFSISVLIGAFAVNNALYFSTMALEFGLGSEAFGLLTAALAVGALSGALFAASRARALPTIVVGAAGLVGVSFAASALMPSYWLYAATLVPLGFAIATANSTSNAYTQTSTGSSVRGRVLALYMVVLVGGGPPAALLLGWLASSFGPRAAVWAAAVGGLLAFAIGVIWLIVSGRLRDGAADRFDLRVAGHETDPPHKVAGAG